MAAIELSDADLLRSTRNGDSAAFATLYRRHRDNFLGYATRLSGSGTAEDVVAEAVAATWRRIDAGGGPQTAFAPYVCAAIRNGGINEFRRSARVHLSANVDALGPNIRTFGVRTVPSAETTAMASIGRTDLYQSLARLPPRWRHVLVRIYLEDASTTEVAAELGIRIGATRQLVWRAKRGLRDQANNDLDSDPLPRVV